MKSPSSFRLLRVYSVLFVFLQSIATSFSQSPDALAGTTFDMQITGANSNLPKTGRYLLLLRGHANYVSYNINGVLDSEGPYLYQRTGFYTGEIGYQGDAGSVLNYQTATTGDFSSGYRNSPAYQVGNFKAYTGNAPASLSDKVIRVQSVGGDLDFGGGGTYRIVTTSGTTYVAQNSSGTVVHSGTYTYARANRSSGILYFQDGFHSSGMVVLSFETDSKGLSLVRKSNQQHQVGGFILSDLRAPFFTSHPTNRSVGVGSATTFSAVVVGTGPFEYQWFKGNTLIEGETARNYTIPSVQLDDAGSYRVVASNLAGNMSSASAVLTPLCGYSISTNSLPVNFRGGNQNVSIFASGTCPWTAETTNDWITITSATAGEGDSNFSFNVEYNDSDTPRTGYLQIAGKTLTVAQGARFALPDIAGKTLRLRISNESSEEVLLILGSGTNRQMKVVSFDTNSVIETTDYIYSATSSSNALIQFDANSLALNFESAKRGTFSVTIDSEVSTGSFTMIPSAPDFNEDGRGDLVMQRDDGVFAAWHLQNTNFFNVQLLRGGIAPTAGARGFGTADFNQDGYSDIAMQDSSGRLFVWYMQGTNRIGGVVLRNGVLAPGWRPFSTADVNGDGHPDILFQNRVDGRLSAWLFNGTTFLGGLSIRDGKALGVGWRAMGAADLDGDAQTDILLQHTSGKIAAWFLNGGQFVSVEFLRDGVAAAKWKVVGISDINEDGSADILWQNASNQVATWLFEDKEYAGALLLRDGKSLGIRWRVFAPK